MKVEARNRKDTAVRLIRGAKESGWVYAGRCSSTRSRKILVRTNNATSSCSGMRLPGWVATSGDEGLFATR